MSKWLEKDIVNLTDEELIDAYSKLSDIFQNYENKISDPKYAKKFLNQPLPSMNLVFIELRNEVNAELAKREIIP